LIKKSKTKKSINSTIQKDKPTSAMGDERFGRRKRRRRRRIRRRIRRIPYKMLKNVSHLLLFFK
jgi:hypothetical protein